MEAIICRSGPLGLSVREKGLEPSRPKTQVPKTCVSANFTTPACPMESRTPAQPDVSPKSLISLATWPVALTL